MLKLPEFSRIGDVTVFADDQLWYRFYLIGKEPSIRLDEKGQPVFLLVEYQIDAGARRANPSLPAGAGYVNFDVQMIVSPDDERRARAELQRWVDVEFARRKSSPSASDGPEMREGAPPRVILADPTWSKGVVKLYAPQSETLVSRRIAEEPASLLAGNGAVFNMDLTAVGADFLVKTIIGDGSAAAIDLTPIQVLYDLSFWGRMPPVAITLEAHSSRVYTAALSLTEGPEQTCTPDQIKDTRRKVSSSSLAETGAITMHVDNADPTLSQDAVQALQKMAFDMFDSMLEKKFLTPAAKSPDDKDDEDDKDTGNKDPSEPTQPPVPWAAMLYEHVSFGGRSQAIDGDVPDLDVIGMGATLSSFKVRPGDKITFYTEKRYQGQGVTYSGDVSAVGQYNDKFASVRVHASSTRKYRLKERHETETMDLELSLSQSQVVEWRVAPQATLETFFRGMTPAQIAQHVRKIALGDPFFSTLQLEVEVYADFESEPIQRVDVEVEYGSGDRAEKRLFTFDKRGQKAVWDPAPSLQDGSREYRYRHRVVYSQGGGELEYTPWLTDTKNRLPITVADPGKVHLDVAAGNIDWTVIRSVSVEAVYEDPDLGVDRIARTLVLDDRTRAASFSVHLFKPVRKPIRVVPTFFLKDGGQIAGEAASVDEQATIHMPFRDFLDVTVVPTGDFTDVLQVVVSLRYDDGTGMTFDKHVPLTAPDQLARWTVALKNPERRTFEYSYLVVYKSAPPLRRDWQSAEGDQAVPIAIPSLPRLKVNVLANLVDFKATPVVKVDLAHPGAPGQSFSFTGTGALSAVWSLPLREGESPDYSYAITYYPPTGDPVARPPEPGRGTDLLIPVYRPKEVKEGTLEVRLMGNLLDFAATPLVQIDVRYRDPEHGIDRTEPAVLTKDSPSAAVKFTQADANKRDLTYTVTYFRAGTAPPIVAPEQTTSVPTIIVRQPNP